MSGPRVGEFLDYWATEGAVYARRGDYDWMAAQVRGQRVVEIGCGLGFGTEALIKRGLQVLALDNLAPCLEATTQRVGAGCAMLQADLSQLDPIQTQTLADFGAETVVCWLMGAPAEATGAVAGDGGKAVIAYRQNMHRRVAELAAALPTVTQLHLVDRTAIAWAAKDVGRDILVNYHLGKTLADLPWTTARRDALYRKLEGVNMGVGGQAHGALRGAVPVLASLSIQRKT